MRKHSVSVVIHSPTAKVISPIVRKTSEGYNMSFTPQEVGEYVIKVYGNGKAIKESPFRVDAVSNGSMPPAPVQTKPQKIKFANPNQVKQPEEKQGKPWGRRPSDNRPSMDRFGKPKDQKPTGDHPNGKYGKRFGKPAEEEPEWMNPHLKGLKKKPVMPLESKHEQPQSMGAMKQPSEQMNAQHKLKPWQKQPKSNKPEQAQVKDSDFAHQVPLEPPAESSNLKPWQKNKKATQNASKVKVYGDGITSGLAGQPCKFIVDSSDAGSGELGFAISGPGKAVLTPKDIGAGKCELSYIPSLPGVYSIEVTYNKSLVPNAPFKPTITLPKKTKAGTAGSKAKAYGDGLKEAHCHREATFMVDTSECGPGKLSFDIKGPSKPRLTTKDVGGKKCQVSYIPTCPGQYAIEILYDGSPISNSPFRPKVLPADDAREKVKVYGDGIIRGEINKSAKFVVDTNASGPGKLDFHIQGPCKPKITTKEVEKGKTEVSYTPTLVGTYTVDVTYNGKSVVGAPFKPIVKRKSTVEGNVGKVKVYGDALTKGETNKSNTFIVDMIEAGPGKLDVDIRGPNKPQLTTKEIGMCKCEVTYIPMLIGTYHIDVRYNGQSVAGAPFRASITQASKPIKSLKNVTVSGSGLETGEVNQPNTFIVDAAETGLDKPNINITGPSKPKLEITEIEPGKYEVSYVASAVGTYTVNAKYDGTHIPGSPFKPNIKRASRSHPSEMVNIFGEGISKCEMNKPNTFTVDTTKAGDGELACDIKGPSEVKMVTENVRKGIYVVSYTPTLSGTYTINVLYNGKSVPGAPFSSKTVHAIGKPTSFPNKVRVYGDGLLDGYVNRSNTFVIDKSEAGDGKIDFDFSGPIKPKVATKELEDGKCEVTYIPTLIGNYAVDVTYNGKKVPGSPFKPVVKRSPKSSTVDKVKVYGDGLVSGVVGKEKSFVVDMSEAGFGELDVDIRGPSKPHITKKNLDTSKCEFTYTPRLIGTYTANVTYNGSSVPGCPFKFHISSSDKFDKASKVKVYGDGLVSGEVNALSTFIVDTVESGPGKLEFAIKGSSKPTITTTDLDMGKCKVAYAATMAGTYDIDVLFDGVSVAGSPFKVDIKPVAETPESQQAEVHPATRVKVYGDGVVEGKTCKPARFVVDTSAAGSGELGFNIKGPGKTVIAEENLSNSKCAISYTPMEAGVYVIDVTYNKQHVPGSPFRSEVVDIQEVLDASTKVRIYGEGLKVGEANVPSYFVVDTSDSGPGNLEFAMQGPTKPTLSVKELSPVKHEVSYVPSSPGEYVLDVLYNKTLVSGAPFRVEVHPHEEDNKTSSQISKSETLLSKVKCPITGVKLAGNSEQLVMTNSPVSYIVDTIECQPGKLGFELLGPSKTSLVTRPIKDGVCEVSYVPTVSGEYALSLTYNDVLVSTSPVRTTVYQSGCMIPNINEPLASLKTPSQQMACPLTKVVLIGDELESGSCGKVKTFVLDTSEAGVGELELGLTGPSKIEFTTNQIDTGRYEVSFIPTQAGNYVFSINYNKTPLSISPLAIAVSETSSLLSESIPDAVEGTVEPENLASTQNPSVATINKDTAVLDSSNAQFVSKTRKQCPQTKVILSGDNIASAECNQLQQFIVDTADSGPGKLGFDISGPSKVSLTTESLDSHRCAVSYVPTQVGDYIMNISYNDTPLCISPLSIKVVPFQTSGSIASTVPMTVHDCTANSGTYQSKEAVVSPHVDDLVETVRKQCSRTKVIVDADAKSVLCNQLQRIIVDTAQAGPGKLRFDISGPSKVDLRSRSLDDGKCEVSFVPTQAGEYVLSIQYNGSPLSISPMNFKALSKEEPGVLSEKFQSENDFNFHAQSEIVASTPDTSVERDHAVVADTELRKQCSRTKVSVTGSKVECAECNQTVQYIIDQSEASTGKLEFRLKSPTETNMSAIDLGDGKCQVSYIPTIPGEYALDVIFNDKPLEVSPLCMQIASKIAPTRTELTQTTPIVEFLEDVPERTCKTTGVSVNGHGISCGKLNQVSTFIVNTQDTEKGELELEVEGPGSAEIIVKALNECSYEVSFIPSKPGKYNIDIFYGKRHVFGNPLTVTVPSSETENIQSAESNQAQITLNKITAQPTDGVVLTETTTGALATTLESPQDGNLQKEAVTETQSVIQASSNDQALSSRTGIFSDVPEQFNITCEDTTSDTITIEEIVERNEDQLRPLPQLHQTTGDFGGTVEQGHVDNSEDFATESIEGMQDQITPVCKPSTTNRSEILNPQKLDEATVSYAASQFQHGGETVESCFTISEDTVCEDSYTVTDSPTTTAPTSSTYNIGDFVIESSAEISDQKLSGTDFQPVQCGVECGDIESSFTISADAVVEESYPRYQPVASEHSNTKDLTDAEYTVDKRTVAELELCSMKSSIPEQTINDDVAVASMTADEASNFSSSAEEVRISGDCLSRAVVNKKETFTIDMSTSGPGNLNLNVTGPAKPELVIKDAGKNCCQVAFVPKEMGLHVIDVTFNGRHIPGSPFSTHVTSRSDLDVQTVKTLQQNKAGILTGLLLVPVSCF